MKLLKVGDKEKKYEHIIYFPNVTTGYYTDLDWLHSLRIDPNATFTRQDPLTGINGSSSLSGARYAIEANRDNNCSYDVRPTTSAYGSLAYTGSYGNSDTTNKLPYLGLVNRTYDSKHIYQSDKNINLSVGKKTLVKNTKDTLLEGAAILGALDENRIQWKPKFKTFNNGIATNYDVKVKLVVGTFDVNDTITSGSVVCKNENQTEDYLVTSGGTCSFDFKMPKDGIVFAKWWPADASIYSGGNWEITLDIPSCYQYTRTESES